MRLSIVGVMTLFLASCAPSIGAAEALDPDLATLASNMGHDGLCEYQTDRIGLSIQQYTTMSREQSWSITEWPDPDCIRQYFGVNGYDYEGTGYGAYLRILDGIKYQQSCTSLLISKDFVDLDRYVVFERRQAVLFPEFAHMKGKAYEICGDFDMARRYYQLASSLGVQAAFLALSNLDNRTVLGD